MTRKDGHSLSTCCVLGWALALRVIQKHKDPGWGAEFQGERHRSRQTSQATQNARWKMRPPWKKDKVGPGERAGVRTGAGRRRQEGRPCGPRWKPTVRAEFTCLILSTSERACVWRWVFKEAMKVK